MLKAITFSLSVTFSQAGAATSPPLSPRPFRSNFCGDMRQKFVCLWLKMGLGIHTVQCGAGTCSEGFVICFLKVPLACLGSMAAAVQPNGILQNLFHNLTPHIEYKVYRLE